VLILLVTQVFLEGIVPPLGRKIPRISSSSILRGSSSSYKRIPPSNKRKSIERVQKGIAYWDKQDNDVLAPNCMLKVREEIIKVEGL